MGLGGRRVLSGCRCRCARRGAAPDRAAAPHLSDLASHLAASARRRARQIASVTSETDVRAPWPPETAGPHSLAIEACADRPVARLHLVQTGRATGGEPGARIVYLSGGGDR